MIPSLFPTEHSISHFMKCNRMQRKSLVCRDPRYVLYDTAVTRRHDAHHLLENVPGPTIVRATRPSVKL
jgi:hypothetical protein